MEVAIRVPLKDSYGYTQVPSVGRVGSKDPRTKSDLESDLHLGPDH